jgi:hypothetical protein
MAEPFELPQKSPALEIAGQAEEDVSTIHVILD